MPIWEIFHLKNCNYLFINDYWTTNSDLINVRLQYSNPGTLPEFRQKFQNNFENGKILGFFCRFRCKLKLFYLENYRKLFGKAFLCLLTLLNNPIHEIRRKFDKNCIKTLKKWKIFSFLSFSVSSSGVFFICKTAIISWEKPTEEHQFRAMLSGFMNCIKTLKIETILFFFLSF